MAVLPQLHPVGVSTGEGVLIQGEQHSFHHRALSMLLPGAQAVPTRSFPRLAHQLSSQPGTLGLMAIENSVAGALLTNYLLLEEHELRIVAEVYLRISHAVLGTPDATLNGLATVESHPMALRQCRTFLRDRPSLRSIEVYDTAGAAAAVAKAGDAGRAAVAPYWCAEAFGLQVLAKAVEDNPHNWTRFVLVQASSVAEQSTVTSMDASGGKTSIAFSVGHATGNLVRVLTKLADNNCSLTKIQSLPLVGKPWEYRFFADFLHDTGQHPPTDVLAQLAGVAGDLTFLGTYAEGQHFEP